MDRLARAVLAIAVALQLAACMLPLSADFGLYETKDYVSDGTLQKINDEHLTSLQVRSLLGDPTGTTADGKAMGYVQCASWSVRCVDVVIVVPAGVHRCREDQCRQVGIWFDEADRAFETKAVNWDGRLKDCSLELWLSNRAKEGCYPMPRDFEVEDESAFVAGDLALVAPGSSRAGVFSIQQAEKLLFGRLSDSYVDWHRMLRLDPGTYTISYYAGSLLRTDTMELKAGHKYVVGSASCSSWTRERGCRSGASLSMRREANTTFLWLEDATTGQILGGSKTEPEFTDP